MTRQSLIRFGYRVLSAANGEEALRLSSQETLALAILDLVMPRMGGAVAAVQLRNRFPNLPIIFISDYSESQHSAISEFPNSSYLRSRTVLPPSAVPFEESSIASQTPNPK
jgi:two-component system, cell cycle sensor histidine kinase and response regulator CckA